MGQEVLAALGTVQGGYDESVDAAILPDTKFARGVNLTIRGGFARTRPAFVCQSVQNMPTGTYQGGHVWRLDDGDLFAIVVSGEVYTIDISTMVATKLSGGPFLDTSAQCYFCQADRYMVIQDGASTPVIMKESGGVVSQFVYADDASYGNAGNDGYDGAVDADFVADPSAQSVPVGTVMKYVMGRLHVSPTNLPGTSKTGRPYFLSGDVVKPSYPEDVLRFSETTYFDGGGAHGMPTEMGYINGMAFYRNSEAGTGSGDLYAIGRNGVAAFAVSAPRSTWNTRNIAQGLFEGVGTKSPWSVTEAQNDIVFRGLDGLRMVSYTTAQQWRAGSLNSNPMSTEAERYMDDSAHLPYVSTCFYDNQLFATVEGTGDRYFQGLLGLDVNPTVNLGNPTTGPGYFGVWTGANFGQVLTARVGDKIRMFVFAQGPKLYLVDADADADVSSAGVSAPIESAIMTKSYHWGNFSERKKLRYVDLWVSELSRDTTITVYARPYKYPYWAKLSDKSLLVGEGGARQMRHRLRFPIDDSLDVCDPVSGRPLYNAPEFQFLITWAGRMQLDRAVFGAEVVSEGPPDPCAETEEVVLTSGAGSGTIWNDFEYSIEG